MYKRGLIVLLMLLLTVSLAAGKLQISHEVINNKIRYNEEAKINLTIINDGQADNFRFSLDNFKWFLYTEDMTIKNTGLYMNSGATTSAVFIFKPKPESPGGTNLLTLEITADNSDLKQTYDVQIYLSKEALQDYVPDVKIIPSIPATIDPRNEQMITLNLENKNRKDIKVLNISLKSSLFDTTISTSLKPMEKKQELVKVLFNPLTRPLNDKLEVTGFVDDIIISTEPKEFSIIDYTGEFEQVQPGQSKKWCWTETELMFRNTGNNDAEKMVKHETTFWNTLFSYTEPKAKIEIIDGKRYYTWTVNLAPQQEYTARVVTNYRIPVIMLIALILFWIIRWATKAPVSIRKRAEQVDIKEGGISEIRIALLVKNESGRTLEHLEVRDVVPSIASISKSDEVGTIAPDKQFKNTKGNNVMEWKINFLDPHEERIITYAIKSRLSILGDFTLPVALIKFRAHDGKEIFIRSNELSISSPAVKREEDEE